MRSLRLPLMVPKTWSTVLIAALTIAGVCVTAAIAQAETKTFTHTGGEQTFIVPAGVTKLNVVAIGGRGGAGHAGGSGGFGARALAELAVIPGQLLIVLVGGNGTHGQTDARTAAGGFNGGGTGGASGGGPCHGGGGGGANGSGGDSAGGGGGGGSSSFGSFTSLTSVGVDSTGVPPVTFTWD